MKANVMVQMRLTAVWVAEVMLRCPSNSLVSTEVFPFCPVPPGGCGITQANVACVMLCNVSQYVLNHQVICQFLVCGCKHAGACDTSDQTSVHPSIIYCLSTGAVTAERHRIPSPLPLCPAVLGESWGVPWPTEINSPGSSLGLLPSRTSPERFTREASRSHPNRSPEPSSHLNWLLSSAVEQRLYVEPLTDHDQASHSGSNLNRCWRSWEAVLQCSPWLLGKCMMCGIMARQTWKS